MICIKLCINDDGSMAVSSGQEEAAEMEQGEAGAPVASIEEALQAIKGLAESAGITQDPMAAQAQAEQTDPMAAQAEEQGAMEQAYRGR